MQFHWLWDSSVASAPPGFQTTVQQVGADIAAMCPSPIDVTIQGGWGTILGGSPLPSGALGVSAPNGGQLVSFATLRAALLNASPTLVLPTTDPNPTGAPYTVNPATAKALGLMPNGTGLDGWIGFDSQNGVISFDRANLNGQYDAYGVIFHEVTEILGRSISVSFNSLEPLDLMHYAAANQPIYTMTPGYFSTDGGVTPIKWFNTISGADAGDWRGDDTDPCNAFGFSGILENPTTADWSVLRALAYMSTGITPPPPAPSCTLQASPTSLSAPGNVMLFGTTSNATSAFIDNGVGPVSLGTFSKTVFVGQSTAFTLTAVDAAGNMAKASISVVEHTKKPPHPHKLRQYVRMR